MGDNKNNLFPCIFSCHLRMPVNPWTTKFASIHQYQIGLKREQETASPAIEGEPQKDQLGRSFLKTRPPLKDAEHAELSSMNNRFTGSTNPLSKNPWIRSTMITGPMTPVTSNNEDDIGKKVIERTPWNPRTMMKTKEDSEMK